MSIIPHNNAARRRKARQRYHSAHNYHFPEPAQSVTLRLAGRTATVDALADHIREQDTLMRRYGLGTWQRSYVHSSAMAEIYSHCQTDADYQLYQDAYAQVIEDGTVPLAEDVMRPLSENDPSRCLTRAERVHLVAESVRIGWGGS